MLLLALGCFDYEIAPQTEEPEHPYPFEDSGIPAVEVPAEPPLACDADPVPLSDEVGRQETCAITVGTGTMDVAVEWTSDAWNNYKEWREVLMAPAVGDLDADGVPDIIVVADSGGKAGSSSKHGVMRRLRGDDGSRLWDVQGLKVDGKQIFPYRYSNVAIGDADGDGKPEIAVVIDTVEGGGSDTGGGDSGNDTSDSGGGGGSDSGGGGEVIIDPAEAATSCYPALFEADGTVAWVGWEARLECGGHAPTLADLDGDGRAEVVVGPYILDGKTGAREAKGNPGTGRSDAYTELGMHSVVADLDGDGKQEVIAGRTVFDADGTTICDTGKSDGFAGVADFDLDGQGEFVVVGRGKLRLFDTDCSELMAVDLAGGGNGGPPTIADVDGDLVPEVGVADAQTYTVYRREGSALWSASISDASSQATGSALYDLEGDGRPEIVYGDETGLWIFDGATGEVRLREESRESRTLHEIPVIADVDGDGAVEILVPNAGSHHGSPAYGVFLLGSASGSWLIGRPTWNQHAWCQTNAEDDLGIPASPESNWPTHNNFRAGDPVSVVGGQGGDAVPVVGTCLLECQDGNLVLAVRVGNEGVTDLPDIPIEVWTEEELLFSGDAIGPIAPGKTSESLTFRFPAERVRDGTLTIIVDKRGDAQAVRECQEDDNSVEIEARCP